MSINFNFTPMKKIIVAGMILFVLSACADTQNDMPHAEVISNHALTTTGNMVQI
jgi:hypothetical protein